jgi:hypothetical protein
MKKMKPYKITSNAALYRVKDAGQVNQELVDSVDWPKSKVMLGFDFKQLPLVAGKPPRFKVSKELDHRIACYSPGIGLKKPEAFPAAGIEVRSPKSFAELKKVNTLCHKAFYKQWGKLVRHDYKAELKEYEKDYLAKTQSLIILKNGKPAGLYSHMQFQSVLGMKLDTLTWHNLLPGLSLGERRSAHYQAALWLKDTCTTKIAVVFSLFDREAYEFFSGLGFYTRRALFIRRN